MASVGNPEIRKAGKFIDYGLASVGNLITRGVSWQNLDQELASVDNPGKN